VESARAINRAIGSVQRVPWNAGSPFGHHHEPGFWFTKTSCPATYETPGDSFKIAASQELAAPCAAPGEKERPERALRLNPADAERVALDALMRSEAHVLISEKINAAINAQIGFELGNSNQYLSIASYFEAESLFGLAKLFFKQADEEREHAMKLLKFVLDSGGKVDIPSIPAPRSDFASAEDAAQFALDSELRTTQQVYDLVELATREKNYITTNFLQWFVSEQLEEVSSAQTRLAVIKRSGPNVLMVEAYLAHQGK
jgi:ferritin